MGVRLLSLRLISETYRHNADFNKFPELHGIQKNKCNLGSEKCYMKGRDCIKVRESRQYPTGNNEKESSNISYFMKIS